jgi:hypothetical protein
LLLREEYQAYVCVNKGYSVDDEIDPNLNNEGEWRKNMMVLIGLSRKQNVIHIHSPNIHLSPTLL